MMGGAQRYVLELARDFSLDYRVSVGAGGRGALKEKLTESGIETYDLSSVERDIGITRDIRSFIDVYRLVKNTKPNILHLNSSKVGLLGAIAGRLVPGCRVVFTAHGWAFYEDRGILMRICLWFFSYLTVLFSHRVLAVSQRDAEAFFPFLSKKIVYIPTGVREDLTFLSKEEARRIVVSQQTLRKHDELFVFGTIAEHTSNKNISFLLTAFQKFITSTHSPTRLVLIGEGEDTHSLKILAHSLRIEGYVDFAGYHDDAWKYLSAFDVFVLPSKKEGMPYAILEAGIAGIPVIASNTGGIPTLIEHGKTGLLINPYSIESLTQAMEHMTNERQRNRYASSLKERVMSDYTFSRMKNRTLDVYTSILTQ